MRKTTYLTFAAAALIGSCAFMDHAGHTTTSRLGNVATTPAFARSSPIAPLQTGCGSADLTRAGSAVIRRQPYLQQVTASSAMIGWVTTSPAGERVEVTTVDGQPVMTSRAEIEDDAARRGREKQVWTHVTGLQPDTSYCYRLANGSPLSGRIGFRTAPSADSTRPIRFLAFGDSGGGGADQRALLAQMYKVPYDLIVHTGDLAYDMGTIKQFEKTVFSVYATLFRSIPLFPAAGNHEYKTMRGAPFRAVFSLPGDGHEQWYSYDWGRIHFSVIDTEASYATQAKWLDKDLAASTAPWKIVYLHRPPYSSGYHGSDLALRAALAPVFEKHRVQLVLAGHDHDYERMTPQNGVQYVVTGGGGVGTRSVGHSAFTAYSAEVIHFVYAEVGTDELVLHAIDAHGHEFDSTVIPRQR
jgi:hypothetical protein